MDRDENGRYLKGHKSNGGRPSRPKEEQYYRILMTTCTADDWKAIVSKAIDQARRGDATARKWLADYIIGAPIIRSEISGVDGGSLNIESYEYHHAIAAIASRPGEDSESPGEG
jgi:hypothetical protein